MRWSAAAGASTAASSADTGDTDPTDAQTQVYGPPIRMVHVHVEARAAGPRSSCGGRVLGGAYTCAQDMDSPP